MRWYSHPERQRGEVFFGNFTQQDVSKFPTELQSTLRQGVVARFIDPATSESLDAIPYSNHHKLYPYFIKYKYLMDNDIEINIPYFYQVHQNLL